MGSSPNAFTSLEGLYCTALLSYLRGSIWLEAGNYDVAAVFFGHAAECDLSRPNYRALYLHAMAESDPNTARRLANQILDDDASNPPAVVAQAANVHFYEAKIGLNAESTTQLCRRLIPILERNKERIEEVEETTNQSVYAMTVGLLGFCHEFLGNSAAAVEWYSLGLQMNPNNDGLLVARGILQYGNSSRALEDFEQAVKLGSPIIWPYFFLAHNYLSTNQFYNCRQMCEVGLRMRGSDTARSELEEWRAIAQAGLGFPPELVQSAFEAAIRLDPSNDSARQNQAAFEASLRTSQTPPHTDWVQMSEADVRRLGLAERRFSLAAA